MKRIEKSMAMTQQQVRQDSKKRSGEQVEIGGPEKKGRGEKETNETKEDSEDGWKMVGVITQVTVSTHSHVHIETQKNKPCCIQSVLRRDRTVQLGEAYGNLLKAGSHSTSETIDVDFTGTDPYDRATEFHVEHSNTKQANTLRYRLENEDYYLAVDTDHENPDQVKLCKLKLGAIPTDDRYYFRIKRTGPEHEFTFQSLKTNKYLHCSNDGKVFMKEAANHNGVLEDRQTWFRCMRSLQIQEQVTHYQKEVDVKLAQIESSTERFRDAEDSRNRNSESMNSKEENSEDSQKENLEEQEEQNSEDPRKETYDGPGKESSRDPEEVTPKDLKEGHSGESEK